MHPRGAVGDEDAAGEEGREGGQAGAETEVGELGGQERFDVVRVDGHDEVDVEEADFPGGAEGAVVEGVFFERVVQAVARP